jgi:TetR/AcrR family transcriptional repressor of mexJK operon
MSESPKPPSRREAKRAEIIAVAKELFFEEGYSATSMARIAAEVGGSKATLYSHFESKQELVLAVIEEINRPGELQPDAGPDTTDFRAWLNWFGKVSIGRITSRDFIAMQRLAAAEAMRLPEFGAIFYEGGVLVALRLVSIAFADAMERGVLRRADPMLAAEQFIELCLGWRLRRVIFNIAPPPTEEETEEIVRIAVEAFMDGYAAR